MAKSGVELVEVVAILGTIVVGAGSIVVASTGVIDGASITEMMVETGGGVEPMLVVDDKEVESGGGVELMLVVGDKEVESGGGVELMLPLALRRT